MSNVFVIIKMCYVHNQWYDISCFTLYIAKNRAVHEVILKNIVDPDRPYDNITWGMRFASRITKATNTHPEYLTLIAFPR